jgi:hypothetical protein
LADEQHAQQQMARMDLNGVARIHQAPFTPGSSIQPSSKPFLPRGEGIHRGGLTNAVPTAHFYLQDFKNKHVESAPGNGQKWAQVANPAAQRVHPMNKKPAEAQTLHYQNLHLGSTVPTHPHPSLQGSQFAYVPAYHKFGSPYRNKSVLNNVAQPNEVKGNQLFFHSLLLSFGILLNTKKKVVQTLGRHLVTCQALSSIQALVSFPIVETSHSVIFNNHLD